jgi:hypothetical protein
VGTTRSGVMGFVVEVLTLAAAFFFGSPAAGLGAAVELGSCSLGLVIFLVVVTIDCLGACMTG